MACTKIRMKCNLPIHKFGDFLLAREMVNLLNKLWAFILLDLSLKLLGFLNLKIRSSTHGFRRSLATMLVEGGGDLLSVKQL